MLAPNFAATITSQAPEALQLLTSYHSKEDPLAKNPLEGGFKLYENNEDLITSDCLIEELDINPELSTNKRHQLEQVLKFNKLSFGLDDCLEYSDDKVQILLVLN